jgi:KipI family sensor histidine kinase inhibitor
MSNLVRLHCTPYGDAAVLVRTAGGDPEQRWSTIQALAHAARESAPDCVIDTVAAYDTLLVEIRTEFGAHADIERWVRYEGEAVNLPTLAGGRVVEVPVVYGGDHGPDLDAVAHELGLEPAELINAHCAERWTIRLLGSPVGTPMMDGGRLPAPVKRCDEPRIAVPAGSVALAGQQCVIYPVQSPGGWRLIGQTPLRLVDVTQTPATRHRTGDIVRFRAIAAGEWGALAGSQLPVAP